jgi:hypothetical protein
MLVRLLADWKTLAGMFAALAKSVVAAHARAVVSFGVVAPNHPADIRLMADAVASAA